MKANGSGDVTAALFTAHLLETGTRPWRWPAPRAASSTCCTTTLESGERELQLVQSQESIAHPRLQFEVRQLR